MTRRLTVKGTEALSPGEGKVCRDSKAGFKFLKNCRAEGVDTYGNGRSS